MKQVTKSQVKQFSCPETGGDAIRKVQREQREILSRLVRIQSETLRGRPPSSTRSGLPPGSGSSVQP